MKKNEYFSPPGAALEAKFDQNRYQKQSLKAEMRLFHQIDVGSAARSPYYNVAISAKYTNVTKNVAINAGLIMKSYQCSVRPSAMCHTCEILGHFLSVFNQNSRLKPSIDVCFYQIRPTNLILIKKWVRNPSPKMVGTCGTFSRRTHLPTTFQK